MIDPDIRPEAAHGTASDRIVRQFAALGAVMLLLLAARDFATRGATPMASSFVLAAALVLIAALLRPGTIRPVYTAATMVTTPIRIVVSAVLLRLMYYGIFTPLAVIFRMIGRDALARRRVNTDTYWTSKTMPTDMKSYFRQS